MQEPRELKVVSEVPLEARRPQRSQWALVALLAFLAAGLGAGVWLTYASSQKPEPREFVHEPEFEEGVSEADKEASLRKMNEISRAVFEYRDRIGGGQRFPQALEELMEIELLPREYSFRGVLSQRAIVYRPEMPAAQDPALWVLAHDRLYGRRPNPRGYGYRQGMIGAVVIFGDGNVRWLDEKEVSQFGALNDPVAAR
ncbi:MAG: hypothetical protein KBG84_15160 [Planctomycetes bacterium]|nr:hypothetical protein [Planctomycetota bacterium]